MNRLTYEDVASILAMRDEDVRVDQTDEELVMSISAALPRLPKRNGSFVPLTRDAVALCYCLLFTSEPEVKDISRRALRYLNRVDDYWSDSSADGDGTLDDQLVLAMATQEIRRRYGISSGYYGPVVDPIMASKIETHLESLREKAISDAFLIAGAKTRMMELELMNVGRLAQRLKRNIAEVVAVVRDLFAPEESRELARCALTYLLEEKDEIPDHLGVVGLIDDNYAMIYALEKGGSDAAELYVALDRVVGRWPWLLNMVVDDGRYLDTLPDWLILCLGSLQQLSIFGGGQRLVSLGVPACDCLPSVLALVSAVALLEQLESKRTISRDEEIGAAGEVRALDRILWTRRPCDPGSISCGVVIVTDLDMCESAVNGISLLGETLGEAVTWGFLNERATVDEYPCSDPAILVSPELERVLEFCNGPSRDRRVVVVDASAVEIDSARLRRLKELDSDVLLVYEHRDERTLQEAKEADGASLWAGRAELGNLRAPGAIPELSGHPILNLERRLSSCARRRITPHLVRCPLSVDLSAAVERAHSNGGRSPHVDVLEEALSLSRALLCYPGLLQPGGTLQGSLRGLLSRLDELPDPPVGLEVLVPALTAFAEKLSVENGKYELLLELADRRGRLSLATPDRIRADLEALQMKGAFPSVVELVGSGDRLIGSLLEDCPHVLAGWPSGEAVRRQLEPPKTPEIQLLLYPDEYARFKERERQNIIRRRRRGRDGLTRVLSS